MSNLIDNYPRGKVTYRLGTSTNVEEGTSIEMYPNHILYRNPQNVLILMPMHRLELVQYENIPQEIIDKRNLGEQKKIES